MTAVWESPDHTVWDLEVEYEDDLHAHWFATDVVDPVVGPEMKQVGHPVFMPLAGLARYCGLHPVPPTVGAALEQRHWLDDDDATFAHLAIDHNDRIPGTEGGAA